MILVARHGETEWNMIGRMQGQKNSPLTDNGLKQANELARVIETYDMEQIFSSPLGRAKETAKIVSEHTNLIIETDDRLQEIDIGTYAGLTKEEVKDRNPGFFKRREANKWVSEWPEGESYADASKRVADFIKSKETLQGSVVIAHRSLNRVLIGYLVGLSPEQTLAIEQSNNDIFEITEDGSYRKRQYENVISG